MNTAPEYITRLTNLLAPDAAQRHASAIAAVARASLAAGIFSRNAARCDAYGAEDRDKALAVARTADAARAGLADALAQGLAASKSAWDHPNPSDATAWRHAILGAFRAAHIPQINRGEIRPWDVTALIQPKLDACGDELQKLVALGQSVEQEIALMA